MIHSVIKPTFNCIVPTSTQPVFIFIYLEIISKCSFKMCVEDNRKNNYFTKLILETGFSIISTSFIWIYHIIKALVEINSSIILYFQSTGGEVSIYFLFFNF